MASKKRQKPGAYDGGDDEEFNWEGYRAKAAAQYPYEGGTDACGKFHKDLWTLVKFNLAQRAERLEKQGRIGRKSS